MKTKITILVIFITYFLSNKAISIENKIVYKLNNEIITQFDIEQETRYLSILNSNLKKLDKNKLNLLATDSLLQEKIKELEIKKFYIIEKTLDDPNLKNIISSMYKTLGFKDENEFEIFLNNQELELNSIRKKVAIEMLWNNLIVNKFNNQIIIDKNKIIKKIEKEITKLNTTRELLLSEILINNEKDLNIENLYEEILNSSKNIGFDNTANIFSKSDSSKSGGKIGWINERSLSAEIYENIKNLNEGDITKPIKISDNYIILKINKIKLIKEKINKDKIIKDRVSFEKNQQLERYSIAYFKRVKQNLEINEQ